MPKPNANAKTSKSSKAAAPKTTRAPRQVKGKSTAAAAKSAALLSSARRDSTILKLVLVAVMGVLAVVAACIAYSAQQLADSNDAITAAQIDEEDQDVPSNYLHIKEWGIKVDIGKADPSKITYSLSGPSEESVGKVDAVAGLKLRDTVTTNPQCQKLSVAIYRQKISDSTDADEHKSVNGYRYGVIGNPFACGDAKLDALRQQYTGNNPSLWKYSVDED